jgi:hypothetical protein
MRRMMLLLSSAALLPILAGCPAPPPPEPPPATRSVNGLDYKTWPQLTPKPVPVAVTAWQDCRAPDPDSEFAKQSKKYGPHFSPAVRVFANPVAEAHLRSNNTNALPVGSVIVKEKLTDDKATEPHAYAAMIKREAGYDPDHGDWEYVYADLGEGGKVERGKIESCIACHTGQAKQDYLFLPYLKR